MSNNNFISNIMSLTLYVARGIKNSCLVCGEVFMYIATTGQSPTMLSYLSSQSTS